MLDDIGLLDDDFFFSCEDMDLAWRAQLQAIVASIPKRVVVPSSRGNRGGITPAITTDACDLALVKNVPGPLWRKHARKIVRFQLAQAWQAVRAWRGAAARARLRGMAASLAGLPKMLRKRRDIQRGAVYQ